MDEYGDAVLDIFVRNFDERARSLVGDAEFDFITYALHEAEKEDEELNEDAYMPSRGSFVIYSDQGGHTL